MRKAYWRRLEIKRFIEEDVRTQSTLLPETLDDYVADDNPVRAIDAFVGQLDLLNLGFDTAQAKATDRPGYHPATLLKLYIYGYLNRIQSSRRLEREAQRNLELIWLCGRLAPDFKTIADFRKDNGVAIRQVCKEFVLLCRQLDLFSEAIIALDGSKFKAVRFPRSSGEKKQKGLRLKARRYMRSAGALPKLRCDSRRLLATGSSEPLRLPDEVSPVSGWLFQPCSVRPRIQRRARHGFAPCSVSSNQMECGFFLTT